MPGNRTHISLKNGSLDYKNGHWYRNGKIIKDWTLANAYKFVDSDGYYKRPNPDGSLTVLDVDKEGKPIKSKYIGGTTQEARNKYWEQSPIVRHATDSIANRYGINPRLLRKRLDDEGLTDANIQAHNSFIRRKEPTRAYSNYTVLTNPDYTARDVEGSIVGADDGTDMINSGKVQLINEHWYDTDFVNEHGRLTHPAIGETDLDNIGISAAILKYFRQKAKENNPNDSNNMLDMKASAYYNMGEDGAKNKDNSFITRKYSLSGTY